MKKAVMYGAGNIGRGFIGQLFSQSGYEVCFIDVNTVVLDKLNEEGEYPIRILNSSESRDVIVSNVRGVNGINMQSVAEEIAQADIMATAVGVNVLPRIAKPIAEGLKLRWQLGRMDPLNIIICENLLDANHFLAGLIKQELDEAGKRNFESLVGMVEASIGRMVPVMTTELQDGNILRACVEEYGELPVDKDGFKGEIPQITNMLPSSPFSFYIQRKLFIHNMGHALTAYLGRIKGYSYIWEAIRDPYIKLFVLKAMQDSAIALSREHNMKLENILDHVDDLLYRFGNKQLCDTVGRVGNDTKRKLSYNDRLVGAARLCISQGIYPTNICIGIAAAMRFNSDENPIVSEVQRIITTEGPEVVLKKICELPEDSPLLDTILGFYNLLEKGTDFADIIDFAESSKRKRKS